MAPGGVSFHAGQKRPQVSDGEAVNDGVDFEWPLVESSTENPLEDIDVKKSWERLFDVIGEWFSSAI